MALRKPLVLVNGQIQQIQAGDTLNAVIAENETQQWTNGDTGSHAIGNVVYLNAADTVKKAQANASGTSTPVALATGTVTNGSVGSYQTSGTLSGLTGLTAGATYFLDPSTPGAMTNTAPTTSGQYVVELGVAVSTTEFLIRIRTSILL